MTTYFGFGIADSMFPAGDVEVIKQNLEVEKASRFIQTAVSCLNPSHKLTLDALASRYGIRPEIPAKAPVVRLVPGDSLIVMGVSGLPRLEGRHEYTAEEIASAVFRFSLYYLPIITRTKRDAIKRLSDAAQLAGRSNGSIGLFDEMSILERYVEGGLELAEQFRPLDEPISPEGLKALEWLRK